MKELLLKLGHNSKTRVQIANYRDVVKFSELWSNCSGREFVANECKVSLIKTFNTNFLWLLF